MNGTTIEISINFPVELTYPEKGTVRKAIVKSAYNVIKNKYDVDLNREFVIIRGAVCERFGFSTDIADKIVDYVLSLSDNYNEIKSKLLLMKELEENK